MGEKVRGEDKQGLFSGSGAEPFFDYGKGP
jgi:hypothetical protein